MDEFHSIECIKHSPEPVIKVTDKFYTQTIQTNKNLFSNANTPATACEGGSYKSLVSTTIFLRL